MKYFAVILILCFSLNSMAEVIVQGKSYKSDREHTIVKLTAVSVYSTQSSGKVAIQFLGLNRDGQKIDITAYSDEYKFPGTALEFKDFVIKTNRDESAKTYVDFSYNGNVRIDTTLEN